MNSVTLLQVSCGRNDVVKPIADAVEVQGLTVWMDLRQLTAGDDLEAEIKHQIEETAVQSVVVISRDAGSANEPNLYYADAAEILYLLERLPELTDEA